MIDTFLNWLIFADYWEMRMSQVGVMAIEYGPVCDERK